MSLSNPVGLVHVRPATLDDVSAMAICHTRSIREAYKGFLHPADLAIFNEQETAARIAGQIESSDTVLVALVARQVVGHARWGSVEADYWPYQVLVHALFIDPEHQRNRAGSALLSECARSANSSGHDGMMIGAFIDNKPASDWYSRLGGRVVEESPLEVGRNSYLSVFFAFDDLPGLCTKLSSIPDQIALQ